MDKDTQMTTPPAEQAAEEGVTEEMPCPFCGEPPGRMDRSSNSNSTGHVWFIYCYCGGYTAHAHQHGNTEAEALAAWNRRASPRAEAVSDERVRELLEDAWKRMDRARDLLTDGNPRYECNWGMLDTKLDRAALSESKKDLPTRGSDGCNN